MSMMTTWGDRVNKVGKIPDGWMYRCIDQLISNRMQI
jgi:hypothetical protein